MHHHKKTKKEKILAVLTVVFLFITVGSFLFLVSLNNKERTENLRKEVMRLKVINEIKQKLAKISLATTSIPEVSSKSYLTLVFTDNAGEKILNQKNPNLVLPIASITKLMTAVITAENIDLEKKIKATLDYVGKDESYFVLEPDRIYKVKELLANALIASDNDSARLLSSIIGENNFIAKMNRKARELGMTQTHYYNVTGLDPSTSTLGLNVSTASDLANLIIYIQKKHPEIFKITTNTEYSVCDINKYCKVVTSTDRLLGDKNIKFEIIGGKTGSTDLALKNLALITKVSDGIFLINIVLGSYNNFLDTTSLINQVIINK